MMIPMVIKKEKVPTIFATCLDLFDLNKKKNMIWQIKFLSKYHLDGQRWWSYLDVWQVPLMTKYISYVNISEEVHTINQGRGKKHMFAPCPHHYQPRRILILTFVLISTNSAGSSKVLADTPQPANLIFCGTCQSKIVTFGCLSGTFIHIYFFKFSIYLDLYLGTLQYMGSCVKAVGSEGSSGTLMFFDNFFIILMVWVGLGVGFCNCCKMTFLTQGGISSWFPLPATSKSRACRIMSGDAEKNRNSWLEIGEIM